MDFRFENLEITLEKKFRNLLDEYMLGALIVRPAGVDSKYGLQIIMLDKLIDQNNPDTINIIVRQAADALSRKIAVLQAATSRILIVGPLQFSYVRGAYDANGVKLVEVVGECGSENNGTSVNITAKIKELGV